MKLTDSIKKSAALLGMAAIGATAASAQIVVNIDEFQQPIPVTECLNSTEAYLDILPLYEAQYEPYLMYEWFKLTPEGNWVSVRYNDEGENVGGADREGSRLLFPALTEPMAGEYRGVAWVDYDPNDPGNVNGTNQNGMLDGNEASWWTDLVVVNVVTEPVLISQTAYVYSDDMMGDPIRMSMTDRNVMVGDGNVVRIDIDAHIFGQYENTQQVNPAYNVDIQWYTYDNQQQPMMINNNNMYAGTDADQLTINVTADMIGNVYWAELTGHCGTIQTAEFTLTDVPSVSYDPITADVAICKGEETTLTANAIVTGTGQTLSYQWWMNGMPLVDGAEFDGVTTNTLTIKDGYAQNDLDPIILRTTANPSGVYADTDPFMVTVDKDPVYTTDLTGAPQNLTAGSPLNLTVAADDADSYQWYKDGAPIAGEVTENLIIGSTTTDDSGVYLVHAINDCGVEVPSTSVTVTVTASGITSSVRGLIEGSLSISPNPTTDFAEVRLSLESFAKDASVTLHNNTGQLIASQNFSNTGEISAKFDVNALNLAAGNYFVVINIDGQSVTERLVIAGK